MGSNSNSNSDTNKQKSTRIKGGRGANQREERRRRGEKRGEEEALDKKPDMNQPKLSHSGKSDNEPKKWKSPDTHQSTKSGHKSTNHKTQKKHRKHKPWVMGPSRRSDLSVMTGSCLRRGTPGCWRRDVSHCQKRSKGENQISEKVSGKQIKKQF